MKRALLNKCFLGLGLQIFEVFPLAAQVDVDPQGDEPDRIVFKDVNALGQAALKAVLPGLPRPNGDEVHRMDFYFTTSSQPASRGITGRN